MAIFLICGVLLFLLWNKQEYDFKQKLRWYATRTEPIIEYSKNPRDQYVEDRAQHHREMLAMSGNPWNIPVYSYPYPDVSRSSSQWIEYETDYLQKLGEFVTLVKNQWSLKIKGIDEMSYIEQILKQKNSNHATD